MRIRRIAAALEEVAAPDIAACHAALAEVRREERQRDAVGDGPARAGRGLIRKYRGRALLVAGRRFAQASGLLSQAQGLLEGAGVSVVAFTGILFKSTGRWVYYEGK